MTEFRFDEPEDLAVFVCENVLNQGAPVLFVSHDDNGDWQFLCGQGHSDVGPDEPVLVSLKDIVARDVTLNDVADLSPLETAERDEIGGSWRVHDAMEDIIRANVRQHSCHVMKIYADEQGPGFAYSIGLTKSFGQPELICFGLEGDVMHSMINGLRDLMAEGRRFVEGELVSGVIEGFEVALRRVSPHLYDEYLGYAEWFHGSNDFEAFQIVWPDESGRFPWDPEYSGARELQPETWHPAESAEIANPEG